MLQSVLEGGVQENLGMAMIYTLISQAQEWVEVRGCAPCWCWVSAGSATVRGRLG